MSNWPFIKAEPISLAQNTSLTPNWIQDCIAQDPGILGLGDLSVKERIQVGSGEVLVCERNGGEELCALLVKTGRADEMQFVEAIESWARLQRVNPRAHACSVLVAEQIGARFLNLISVTSAAIPLGAIEMQALKVGGQMTVVFTPVFGIDRVETVPVAAPTTAPITVDILAPAPVPEQPAASTSSERRETVAEEVLRADRAYWQRRAWMGVEMADQLLAAVKAVDPALEFDYQPEFIGVARSGQPVEFAQFRPAPGGLLVGLQLEQNPLIEMSIAQAGLEPLADHAGGNGYTIRLSQDDFDVQRNAVARLMRLAYDQAQVG